MVPASDGGDGFIRISGPDEGLWAFVVVDKEAVDGGLKVPADSHRGSPLGIHNRTQLLGDDH